MKDKTYGIIGLLALLLVMGFYFFSQTEKSFAGSGQISAQVDSVSNVIVGKTANVILFRAATSSPNNMCSSRVISTVGGQAILLKFATSEEAALGVNPVKGGPNLNGTVGIVQAASTTVNYDANVYGCDFVAARGMEASSSIMVAEFR